MVETESAQRAGADKAARDQTLMVYLLYALHLLFGITALIGVIVCHTKKDVTANTLYASHNHWQIVTFWTAVVGYVAALYYIVRFGSTLILMVTLVWTLYRIIKGAVLAYQRKPIGNTLAGF